MRNAEKQTPSSAGKKANSKAAQDKDTSGKKLVQARLPFKILSSPVAGGEDAPAPGSKKRKLSYSEEDANPTKILCKSDVKENITKADEAVVDEVIVLDEDSKDANLPSPKSDKQKSAGGTMKIRLPLSNKKRRKSTRDASKEAEKAESEPSDSENVAIELNPVKKVKLAEDVADEVAEDKVEKEETPTSAKKEKKSARLANFFPKSSASSSVLKKSPKKKGKSASEGEAKLENVNSPSKDDDVVILTDEEDSPSSTILDSIKKSENEGTPKSTKSSLDKKSAKVDEEIATPKTSTKKTSPKATPTASAKKSQKEESTPTSTSRKSARSTATKTVAPTSAKKSAKKGKAKEPEDTRDSDVVEICEDSPVSPSKDDSSTAEKATPKARKSLSALDKKTTKGSDRRSLVSVEGTPKADESVNTNLKKLTPSQSKKQEEKLMRLKEKEEKELQRKREKEEKEEQRRKEKEEKEEQRRKEREEKEEQKKKEREEKEEQKKKERDEREKKRLAELDAKNEEKRKKDEVKEEERRKKEEEENKKKKAAAAFTKFFVQPKVSGAPREDDPNSIDSVESVQRLAFRPFQVKGDMKLAPTVRRNLAESDKSQLEQLFDQPSATKPAGLYLELLRGGKVKPWRSEGTLGKNDDEVVVLEDELEIAGEKIDENPKPVEKYRSKYYLFKENRRPPYHGTWRKKSALVGPRRPFALDKKFFDYEVDSDDEWEEEEPGESLNGSEDEKESEDEDYEVDNEWFVPHGHLSDEEMQDEDESMQDTSREAQKQKLKALQQEFAQEMKKKTEKIKPRLVGTIWQDENGNRPDLCPTVIWESLNKRAMLFTEPPLLVEPPKADSAKAETGSPQQPKRLELNEELIKDLIRLTHGNRHKKVFMVREFLAYVVKKFEIADSDALAPKKSTIQRQIETICEWKTVEAEKKNKKKLCWVVKPSVLSEYALDELSLANMWEYTLEPKYGLVTDAPDLNETAPTEPDEKEAKATPKAKKRKAETEITKFANVLVKGSPSAATKKSPTAKRITDDQVTNVSPKPPPAKKRVSLLMSVPRGQPIPQQSKNALISSFLKKDKPDSNKQSDSKLSEVDGDGVIAID